MRMSTAKNSLIDNAGVVIQSTSQAEVEGNLPNVTRGGQFTSKTKEKVAKNKLKVNTLWRIPKALR